MWLLQLQTLFVIALAFQQVQPQGANAPTEPTDTPTEPIPPPKITSFHCRDKEAEIKWMSPGNSETSYNYTIQNSTKLTPDVWSVAAEEIEKTTYTIPLYYRGVTYLFRVIAIDKAGHPSEPSEMNLVCTTAPDVPYTNPENVKVSGTSPGTFVVSWTLMPQIEHNGPGFHYRVSWRKTGKIEWNEETITDWNQSQFVKQPNGAFHEYECKVEAFNKLGKAQDKAISEKGFPGEGRPFLAPSQFKISRINEVGSAIDNRVEYEFQWEPLNEVSFNGHPIGYKVQLYTDSDFIPSYNVAYGTNELKVTILSRNTVYKANIKAVNNLFQGPISNTIQFQTPPGVPNQIKNFKATAMGSTAVLFKWDKPVHCNGNQLFGYNIYYEEINGGPSEERFPQINDPNITEAKLGGLKENTAYRFHIAAKNELGEGKDVYIEAETKEATIPDVPEFSVDSIDSNNGVVRVTWKPKIDGNPGSHFYVQYHYKGTNKWEKTYEIINENFILFKWVIPNEIYELFVVAVDGIYETKSEIKQFPEEISESVEFGKVKITVIVVVALSVVALIAIVIKCFLCKKCCPQQDV